MANDPLPFSAESWADSKAGLVLQPDALIGGKYRLLRPAGFGGMGAVWVARNEATNADVAVKVLLADAGESSGAGGEANLRFRREAHAAAQLYHRGIVRIFDLVELTGNDAGTLVMVMELLRGETLAHAIDQRRSFTLEETLAIILPLLSALAHAHHAGIVHRDLKPENVFLAVDPDGHIIPKILDFGIAKLPAQTSSLTVDGSVLGTPHYMSPEQIRGQEDLDGRSDMFSMAVLLFEMLTGVRVFQRDTAVASLASVLEHEVDPDPRIEPRVWVAISRALAKRPYERFASCAEFAEALRKAVDATEEDFAQALQELRPSGDISADGDAGKLGSLSSASSMSSSSSRRKKAGKKTSLGWILAAAGAAAVLAVTGTHAVTRSGASSAHADEPHLGASSATSAPSAPTTVSVPTSDRASPTPASAATPSASAQFELPDTPPTPTPSNVRVVQTPLATGLPPPGLPGLPLRPGGTTTTPRGTGTSSSKPPGSAKPVATVPGF